MKRSALLPIVMLSLMSPGAMAAQTNSMPASQGVTSNSNAEAHMDAIEMIMQDHAKIRQMFSDLDSTLDSNVPESRSKFKELKDFLVMHETMEQKVWYPELEKHEELKKIIAPLKKEEQDAGKEIKKVDGMKDDKEWVAGVRELHKAVEHHASQEETNLFPKVKQELDKSTLETIGGKIKKYQDKNMAHNKAKKK